MSIHSRSIIHISINYNNNKKIRLCFEINIGIIVLQSLFYGDFLPLKTVLEVDEAMFLSV